MRALLHVSLRLLRAPRTALAVLAFQAVYAASAVWLPIRFSSPLFLASVALLFMSTLVCTVDRTRATAALWRGEVNGGGYPLARRDDAEIRSFLAAQGFRGDGAVLFRFRFALWGGWILHVGVLALIVGILVQQTMHDGGAFELTEGETTILSQQGAVFGRERGLLASPNPPDVRIMLLAFDPYYHQTGYAPDRASRVLLGEQERFVDRAKGVSSAGITIYQAIPTSLAVNLQIPSMGVRSIHLRRESERRAAADIKDLAGNCARIVATTERPIDDDDGTGAVDVRLHGERASIVLMPNERFDFGGEQAALISIGRWAGFTYSKSPGVPFVFVGFVLILGGSALLVFPAGVVRVSTDQKTAAWIRAKRGTAVIAEEWAAWRQPDAADAEPAQVPLRELRNC